MNTPKESELLGNDPGTLRGLGRDYGKQAEAIFFAAPIALLVYSLDKAGTIGLSMAWEKTLWAAWGLLAVSATVAGFRSFFIPVVWGERAFSAARPNDEALRHSAKCKDLLNSILWCAQLAFIAFGFFLLFVSHCVKSAEEISLIEMKREKEKLELQIEIKKLREALGPSIPATTAPPP